MSRNIVYYVQNVSDMVGVIFNKIPLFLYILILTVFFINLETLDKLIHFFECKFISYKKEHNLNEMR
jgi:hypothetical protein